MVTAILSLSCPCNPHTLNHIEEPNPLAEIYFLWGANHAISFFEVGLPLSGKGPAFSVHLIHSTEAIFLVVHGWYLGLAKLPTSLCYIQILWTTKLSSHRPAHRCETYCSFPSSVIGPGGLNQAICPIFSVAAHYLSQTPFQSSVSNFHLSICLQMIRGGSYMLNLMMSEQVFNRVIGKLTSLICD